MKSTLSLLFLIVFAQTAFTQSEFKTYNNGLIYSDKTMGKLKVIVDSLNLKYKSCDLNRTFYSIPQATGHRVVLKSNVIQAKEDIENGISFNEFITKYPEAEISKNVFVVRTQYTGYDNKLKVNYQEINPNTGDGRSITYHDAKNPYAISPVKNWILKDGGNPSYSAESLLAFYFPEDFSSIPLPEKYNKLISYSDCLIDTTVTKFKSERESGWVDLPENWQDLSQKKKEQLLDEMRSTQVIGGCSQDSRPREHAVNIALLSAETANWEVFLKAHLDIMNDNFDRMSDGSYALARRKTYIKELEELNINVPDLLLGITLRVENEAKNHYYGSVSRLGRAISESSNKTEFRTQILGMIEDNQLDTYNRLVAYFLFRNINNYIDNEVEKAENKQLLEASIKKLPDFITSQLKE